MTAGPRSDARALPYSRLIPGFVFVIATAALVSPLQWAPRRAIDAAAVDTVARYAVTATHDFSVERVDDEAIRTVRAAASAQVLPVWDHDAAATTMLAGAIAAAFAEGRDLLAMRGREIAARDGSATAALSDDEAIAVVPKAERIEVVSPSAALSALVARARVADGVAIADLARDGFRRETEDALTALVAEVLSKNVVDRLPDLEAVGASGITLRTVRADAPPAERTVRQFLNFGDLGQLDALMAPARHHLFYIEDARLRDAIADTAAALVAVNTQINPSETQRRAEAASDLAESRLREGATESFREGEVIVSRGEVIDEETVATLERMRATAPSRVSPALQLLAAAALVLLSVFPVFLFARSHLHRFSRRTKDLVMMCVVMVAQLGVLRLGLYLADIVHAQTSFPLDALYLLAPLAAGSMLVRLLTNTENALAYTLVLGVLAGVVSRFDVAFAGLTLLTGIAGIAAVRAAQNRGDILRSGAGVAVLATGLSLAFSVLRAGATDDAMLVRAAGAALSGVTNTLFVFALLPIVEGVFRYTTPMRLMELANLNHPALKELILKAPGSYHHSMMVGQLVEAACEAVGADALLGRVGSYFHDIGKTKNPVYFAENQQGANPHDKLKPTMSALVIKAHVKDGVELARQHRLPPEIIDFIREHHGTSLISFFHRRALEQADGTDVPESDFRYAGPRPQTRETAICMLADGIEAASRALTEPSHAHLKGLVQKMINRAFIDGQLDESDLTLQDLDAIGRAILLRLTAFYHHRPEYPDARRASGTRRTRAIEPGVDPSPTGVPDAHSPDPPPPSSDFSTDDRDLGESGAVRLRRLDL